MYEENRNGKVFWKKFANIRLFSLPLHFIMSDFAFELAKLLSLHGADFIRQLKWIASLNDFRPLEAEEGIYTVGGQQCSDYHNLLNAARKAVSHGYQVYILPNPKGTRSADFIFKQHGVYKMYDLKTIRGNASVGSRLKESIGQTNRVLLNIRCDYNVRSLSMDIRCYFERSPEAIEVLIFKGNKMISINRRLAVNPKFQKLFRTMYEK